MGSTHHSNQARSACERCRQLKLRCSRQEPIEPCARCTRLGLHCQAGSQRKVGRPKRDLGRLQYEQPQTPDSDKFGAYNTSFQFDEVAHDVVVDRLTPDIGPLEFHSLDETTLPMDLLLVHELEPPLSQTSVPVLGSDAHFETLSKINVELHALCNSIFRHAAGVDFATFSCLDVGDLQGMKAFGVIMQAAQEYLVVIKALHMMIGTKATSPAPSTCPAGQESTVSQRLSHCQLYRDQPFTAPQNLNSPFAFLVVSCFVQLIRPLEFIMTIMHAHIAGNTPGTHPPAKDLFFAGVSVVDFSTQALLAIELTQHALGQIQLVLGLPSSWSARSIWTGLLTTQKYREMLNGELGEVEELWTTRPARLMKLMSATKDVLLENSMTGDW